MKHDKGRFNPEAASMGTMRELRGYNLQRGVSMREQSPGFCNRKFSARGSDMEKVAVKTPPLTFLSELRFLAKAYLLQSYCASSPSFLLLHN